MLKQEMIAMNLLKLINNHLRKLPSALSGLALAIASLGLCWEHVANSQGLIQFLSASLAACIVIPLFFKFLLNPLFLKQDLQHPIAGSVFPTLTMATMTIANNIGLYHLQTGIIISWAAISLQVIFSAYFVFYRVKNFKFSQILPSWFIPPIGFVMIILIHPAPLPASLSDLIFWFGLFSYIVLLPIILFRLIYSAPLNENEKPITVILATPASLLLLGYLAIETQPNILLVYSLLVTALLMTFYAYFYLITLIRLPFTLTYSAFTFPLVVGAITLFRVREFFIKEGFNESLIDTINRLAYLELIIATLIVFYVSVRYSQYLCAIYKTPHNT